MIRRMGWKWLVVYTEIFESLGEGGRRVGEGFFEEGLCKDSI